MKRLLSILILTLTAQSIVYAQSGLTALQKKALAVKDSTKKPLFLVHASNNKEILARHLIIGQSEIASIDLLNVPESKAILNKYPGQKAMGIIEITPKPNVRILNLKEIFDKYSIEDKYRAYKIKIGIVPAIGRKIYASEDDIESVKVDTVNNEIIINSKPD